MKRKCSPQLRLSLVLVLILLVAASFLTACSAAPKPAPATTRPTIAAPTYAPPVPTYAPTAPKPAMTTTAGAPKPYPAPTTYLPGPAPVINMPPYQQGSAPYQSGKSENTIGLAVGGAKDINNFRENIINRLLPLPTDITPEGLFYDYYFDTGMREPADKLFAPSYSFAVSRDPFSRKSDYYLSVGLNSGMKESDFARKKLNLIIVLDISGSMSSSFDEYYYDNTGKQVQVSDKTQKINVAREAVLSILDQLGRDDRFSIVLFNDRAYQLEPMSLVSRTDMEAVQDDVLAIRATGSTNMESGMQLASQLIGNYNEIDPYVYENRVIFLTDAMPNTGETGEYSLLNMLRRNATNRIYTTFIGIGVDFNTELVDYITKTRGANYYSVHSPDDFRERVDEEFDFMVTPLIFNLRLTLESTGWDIEQVYGSPEADQSTGELMKINTLFPSKSEGGETKGGLVLLKLKRRTGGDPGIDLRVTYEDRDGRKDTSISSLTPESTQPEYFDNSGIRKGVLLARYTDLVKDWLTDEREHVSWSNPWEPRVNPEYGIRVPPTGLGTWERQSLPLRVASSYRSLFSDFAEYFADEMDEIGDVTLEQELDIIDRLSGFRG